MVEVVNREDLMSSSLVFGVLPMFSEGNKVPQASSADHRTDQEELV